MNTAAAHTSSIQNVTRNERAFRAALGLGILATVIAGAISAPTAMFAAAMGAIYLVMSAIMGIDPVYAAATSVSGNDRTGRNAVTAS